MSDRKKEFVNSKVMKWMEENNLIITQLLADANYDVRNDGTIWTRLYSTHALVGTDWQRAELIEKDNYLRVQYTYGKGTRGNRKRRLLRAHRVVFTKFHGLLFPGMVINHKDGDKHNNHPDNLEQITHEENVVHGLTLPNHSAIKHYKLSFEIAKEIRSLKEQGWTHRQLCAKFDISKGHVSQIVNNKIWYEEGKAA